ncbi:MAG: rhomboid family intramembrane serine protease [Flavobacteriales bacterium]|nr:rhomboid family intramembrane serine protease [Flavobacteriales bacterium]MCB9447741.1 rhomboid family intramembrane serine protease [Flavobacteriales bacterium]
MITLVIIVITGLVSVQAFSNHELFLRLRFNAYVTRNQKQWYRLGSYALLHADWMHLIVNMFVLYSFGQQVELEYRAYFGPIGMLFYVLLYTSSVVMSIIPSYEQQKNNPVYNSVGASGAVSAVLFAQVLFDPLGQVALYGIIPMPSILFAVVYLGYSWYMGKQGRDNINHHAHFFGAVYGMLFTVLLDKQIAVNFWELIKYKYFG